MVTVCFVIEGIFFLPIKYGIVFDGLHCEMYKMSK